ncbi:hypothetical protein F0562_008394 [Nyssa sinensis]|uniref:PGG domain-containing protein n=1 Tax=Nyssa sinensis TaxID=561372 RepID=A0A5J5A696_9ASTE|nr:hypothetical protein F0562_008394 [Nyssa sinensis]
MKMKENETLNDFSTRFSELVNQMKTYGEDISDARIVEKILISLPEKFDAIVAVVEETKDISKLSIQELMGSLKSYEQRLSQRSEKSLESAFQSKLILAPKMLKRNPQHKNKAKDNRLKAEDKEEEEVEIGEQEEDTPTKRNSMTKSLHKGVTFAKDAAMLRRIVGFEESRNITMARDLVMYKKIVESRQISKQASRKRRKETNLVEGVEGNSGEPSSFLLEKEIENEENPRKNSAGTPLFLATKSGCVDIVERILQLYPQAIEHIDGDGCTILHIAIQYRQMEIFNMVEKMEIPMKRLIKKPDKNLNSILHMVGRMAKDDVTKGMRRGPALELQEDLLLFERVNKISSKNFFKLINADGLTAEDLFALKNKKLSSDAEEWLKRTAKNCSIVAVLIATIAFAAAYTVPGGSNNTGIPVLLNPPLFTIFTIGDVISLTFSLLSIISFLSILTSSFCLEDFKKSLLRKLTLGITFLNLSVSMVMLAFAATIILMMKNEKPWIRFVLYAIAFLPMAVSVIFFEITSSWSLYSSLMKIF